MCLWALALSLGFAKAEPIDPWDAKNGVSMPRFMLREGLGWVVNAHAETKDSPIELEFQQPVYPVQCRHFNARIGELSENEAWMTAVQQEPKENLQLLNALLAKFLAGWSDRLLAPVASFRWELDTSFAEGSETWQKSFKIFAKQGYVETAIGDFELADLNGVQVIAEPNAVVITGSVNMADICQAKKLELYLVKGCQVESHLQIEGCRGKEVVRYQAALAPVLQDTSIARQVSRE
ncbi:MAG TPA: hypothetical protein VM901_07380 [Bdellovibrionota bacterium]|nr:hypothetical protein [Bdellovibrionota bacterium]